MTAAEIRPDFRLDDRVALVTGAAGGIGAAVAKGLAQFGARVGCFDRSEDATAATAEAIRTAGGDALAFAGDITVPDALAAAVATLEDEFGPLRLAVNAAGVHDTSPAEEMSPATWQRLVDVNLTGVLYSCQAEGRAMLRHGTGSIVNVASISATIANRGLAQAHYNATKAAVVQLSRSLALEWVDRGVRVNALSPGYVRTRLAAAATTSRRPADFVDDIPMRRIAEPVEMVGPTVFLLSDAASYVTGSELVADGGALSW